ncbi:hypothetical protein BaRGS_00032278 [Batillaria attramentaria]|uniref:Uncharacterized protein n=1 Tax=Batillaria attramentaria TaxID=370345 RepID=A0ABD0JP24_9CAEN
MVEWKKLPGRRKENKKNCRQMKTSGSRASVNTSLPVDARHVPAVRHTRRHLGTPFRGDHSQWASRIRLVGAAGTN